ncbi:MAG: hypothetical protein Q9187_007138 [Circinaria calcarea]
MVVSQARDLQNSGSDIVVEEDLTELFGRSQIDPQIASSFRTVVTKSSDFSTKLCEGIHLQIGPGPTVTRAFVKDQSPYFAMVLQISLLTAMLQKEALSSAIMQIFEKQAQGAPADKLPRAAPSEEGIFGVLRACEEQSSSYEWSHHLLGVAHMLGLTEKNIHEALPAVILRGLINMLPLVQHFPEDHLIEIESAKGVCLLVVWIYQVLGLSTSVRIYRKEDCIETLFGVSPARVIIDTRSMDMEAPSVTLLATSADGDREILFKLEPDPDESEIDATYRLPAKGYGKAILESIWGHSDGREGVVQEMTLLICGFAVAFSKSLCMVPEEADNAVETDSNDSYGEGLKKAGIKDHREVTSQCLVNEDRLFDATQFLFNPRELKKKPLGQYAELFYSQSLGYIVESRPRIKAIVDSQDENEQRIMNVKWKEPVSAGRALIILLFTFAHVRDLKSCEELPLFHEYRALLSHDLAQRISNWDSRSDIMIGELTWFHAIALLTAKEDGYENTRQETLSLISDQGWSMFLSTFGDRDPNNTDAGFIVIKKGVPCRNGVWKHAVVDGAPSTHFRKTSWLLDKKFGEEATLHCATGDKFGPPLCGERRDSFVVNLRLNTQDEGSQQTRRTGYAELFSALWTVQKTDDCAHPQMKDERLTLAPGCATFSRCGDEGSLHLGERVAICLTAHNKAARWKALIAIAKGRNWTKKYEDVRFQQVLLRGERCCFRCAINQTAPFVEKCIVVL